MFLDEQEADVLGRARAGDERAFLALYRAAQPDLLRYLSVLVGADAERVAAATWEVVARDLSLFAGSLDGFRGWVAGVARKLALEHLSQQDRASSGSAGVVVSDVVPPRAANALRRVVELPRDEAEAVILRSVMRLDEQSSAQVLQLREATLARRARRGLIRLVGRLRASSGPGQELQLPMPAPAQLSATGTGPLSIQLPVPTPPAAVSVIDHGAGLARD